MNSIEIENGVFITKEKVLWLEREKAVVLADLHLGYESVLQGNGVAIPRFQKEVILNQFEDIFDVYRPDRVVINGDFKHEFSRNLQQEWQEVEEVLDYLTGRAEVVLVKGNHDNFLGTITSKRGLDINERFELGEYLFFHGDRMPEKKRDKKVVIGHEHPSLRLKDDIGALMKVPCFLHEEDKGITVLPAFSPLSLGTDVIESERFLSPFLNGLEDGAGMGYGAGMDSARVYGVTDIGLLDFKELGVLRTALSSSGIS